jgi:hypothetical protein
MSNYKSHAMTEFRAAGWIDENGKYCDEMQQAICEHVLKLLEVFANEGHSGSSAGYAVHLFEKLALFNPIFPLTGEDWEWAQIDFGPDMKYQNVRCSHVFKGEDGRAYDGNGKIFWEWWTNPETGEKSKSYFTNSNSRVYIEFPYTPTHEYVERVSEAE